MGNKLGKRRQVVDEKYTRPQGLYQIKDVDYKKLRKLILESKLAPCYPGGDECDCGILEECPICFLYYPTLNRSRCCMKSICTECFLQMKNPNSTRPTQCPFCKTSNYAVEYRGMKSKEERGMEQIEEQKVIEAKIRMRQQELLEEEERQRRKEPISSNRDRPTESLDGSPSRGVECEEIFPSQDESAAKIFRPTQSTRQSRDDEFDMDLEDIMVTEAIWLSIEENGRAGHPSVDDEVPEHYAARDHSLSSLTSSIPGSSASSSSSSNNDARISPSDMLPSSSRSTKRVKKCRRSRPKTSSGRKTYSGRVSSEECGAGTSYASSEEFEGEAAAPSSNPPPLLYGKRRSKRVKNDLRKLASLSRASSEDTYSETMLAGECEFDYGSVGPIGGSSTSSDESDEGMRAIALPPSPPPFLHGWRNSKRVKNNRRAYPPLEGPTGKEWEADYSFVVDEVGTTCGRSDESDDSTALPLPPVPPLQDEAGTSGTCSDDGEDCGDHLDFPPPPPPLPHGWWPSVMPPPRPMVYPEI